jgi:hypothetical protein
MSNVTAQEIIRFTASAFRQDFGGILQPGNTGVGYRHAKPWTRARNVALLLIQRHTSLDWQDIANIFDLPENAVGAQLIRKIAERTEADALKYAGLTVKLDLIETQIDDLHEARCDPQPPKLAVTINGWLHGSNAERLNKMLANAAQAAGATHAR